MTPRLLPLLAAASTSAIVAVTFASGEEAGFHHECLHGKLDRAGALAAPFDDKRFNTATGEDAANYPPDRLVDYQHMRLEVDIPDMNTPEMTATQTFALAAIAEPVRSLSLNAEQLDIKSVADLQRGQAVMFSYDGLTLDLRFDPPLEPGVTHQLRINYEVANPVDGLFWTVETPEWQGRPPQIHTQGQPETNRFWFPSHDFPNERMSTEIIATVPNGFLASSNGKLVSQTSSGGATTFHWSQEKPHVSYLVSLVVGKFDVVDVGRGELDLPVYVPPGKANLVENTYGKTLEMVRVFEDRLGEKYPWDRYAQLVVWNFGAGGMENTSATTLFDTAVLDDIALQDADLESLIAHELAHQWFGDLITCDSWAHIWLNEGFATYCESLWFEETDGFDRGYLSDMYTSNYERLLSVDRLAADAPDSAHRPGMVSRLYEHPWDVFRRRSNPYPKGASIMHMLRMNLGDDLFFESLQTYVDRFKGKTVETSDLRKTFEEVSGRRLEWFFEQWAHRPGTPELDITAKWNESDRELAIVVEQKQLISADTPAYRFKLPILIDTGAGERTVTMKIDGRRHERVIALDSDPAMVVIDPNITVLATINMDQPAGRFIDQLQRGPTVPARIRAAEALQEHAGDDTVAALLGALQDVNQFRTVRAAAAESLGELGETQALFTALDDGVSNARVRKAVIGALGVAGDEEAVSRLALVAQNDAETYAVRAEALDALGETGDSQHMDILFNSLNVDSQHEQIRAAAIRALADLDEPEGLEAVIPFTRSGWLQRLRPTAIKAVGELGHHDEDAAYRAIVPLLTDHEERARMTAGEALIEIGNERAVKDLRRVAKTHRHPVMRESAAEWADKLAAKKGEDEASRSLREDVERLKRELEDLKEKVESQEEK